MLDYTKLEGRKYAVLTYECLRAELQILRCHDTMIDTMTMYQKRIRLYLLLIIWLATLFLVVYMFLGGD